MPIFMECDSKMTLLYEWGGQVYTLEHLIDYNDETEKLWNSIIIDELNFWTNFCLDNLIIESSEAFEEELYELGYDIIFIGTSNEKFDYNKLLNSLRGD